ncbi:Zinc finger Y-chromosomal protein [Folsomia candida]|uniref:Zinc finger Y-chromosomal protein n=1 Tax=Folsomia candida TaxID=158441 RepID=A0A226D650_FOLCA|nr:Zinc finger Y-chromosomal protein [Folsomia candida]
MSTPRRLVCLFCRTGCNSSSSDLFPQFLTYLATINIPVEKNLLDENFCRENFHCCQKCGSLLETIAHHVHQLGQDLLTIYRVTLQNINQSSDDNDDIFEIWRRQSVSQFNTSISLWKDLIVQDNHETGYNILPEIAENLEQETPFKFEQDCDDNVDLEIKIEPDQEIRDTVGISQNLDCPGDPRDDAIPPEEEDKSYLNDILELAEDADDPLVPSPCKREKKASSHIRQSSSSKRLETFKIIKLEDNADSIPEEQPALTSIYARDDGRQTKKCDLCDLTFRLESSLADRKAAVHHNGARHVCTVCKLGFLEIHNYKYHARKCDKPRTTSSSAEIEIADELGTILGVAVNQIVDQDGNEMFQCGRCNAKRFTRAHLITHVRVKHTDESFKCKNPSCGYAFASQAELDDHILAKGHQTRHACSLCAVMTSTAGLLKAHVLSVHQNVVRFTCLRCEHGFYSRHNWTTHEARCQAEVRKKRKPR